MTKEIIVEGIKNAFADLGIEYEFHPERSAFSFGHKVLSKFSSTRVFIVARNSDYYVKAIAPLKADPSDASAMEELAKLIVKINYSLIQGGFDLDFEDGELSYRIGVECTDLDRIPADFVNVTVAIAIKMWGVYGDCFLGVIFGGLDSDAALRLKKD